ncbi:MAG: monovalent cation/H(+) antiporter subunit G [archaeon]|nr:MAG: monovalent cation/H(+) antiporter subunit G [archaeon]
MNPDFLLLLPALIGLIGALGLIRLPNVYTRIFASTMCAVGCTSLLIFILAMKHFYSLLSLKYILLLVLIIFTSPTASHAIANAAYKKKVGLRGRKRGRKKQNKLSDKFRKFIKSRLARMEVDNND